MDPFTRGLGSFLTDPMLVCTRRIKCSWMHFGMSFRSALMQLGVLKNDTQLGTHKMQGILSVI